MAENKKDNRIFKLTNFSPVAFKVFNYPVQFCSVCRGYLSEVCSNCMETGLDKCDVIKHTDVYYHKHCHDLMNSAQKKPVKKVVNESEDDESD